MSADRWVVGSEYDDALFERLGVALLALGYRLGSEWHGVGGSQEISHWVIGCPDGSLTVLRHMKLQENRQDELQ